MFTGSRHLLHPSDLIAPGTRGAHDSWLNAAASPSPIALPSPTTEAEMNPIASTRSSVLDTVRDAAARFHERGDGRDVEGLEDLSPEVASLLARELKTAEDWARSSEGQDEEADEMEGGDDYVSHDPVISTVQSAMDEHADEHPHHEHGKGVSLLRLIAGLLHKRTENYEKFVEP